jgi:nucleotide-binding universal stress UspA family protein
MKVLIATDLSEASLAALDSVCSCEPGVFEAATLLHVIDLDLYTAGGSIPQIMEYAEGVLPEWADRLTRCGIETQVRVEQGPAVETIEDVAADMGADLIVMTNLGRGAATGRLLGSTVEKLASRGRVPVLVERVRESEEGWCRLGGGSPFARVLLAASIDDALPSLLDHVAALPGEMALRVVHVTASADDVLEARSALDEAVAAAATRRAEIAVFIGDPVEVIVEAAGEWKATTVAVASCRHSMLHRAIWGSVARGVALTAPCSVLLVPPRA